MKANLVIVILSFVISSSILLQAEEVKVSDFGSKIILIGRLGKPLGTIATLDGQLVSEPKLGKSGRVTAAFRVNKVDGKPLEKAQSVALIFRVSEGVPPIHINELVQLTGYEGGAYIGTPDEARDSLGRDASPLDWQFESTIYVINSQIAGSTKP
jgi:hypothetical protein